MSQKVFNITADGDTEEFRLLGETKLKGFGGFGGGTVTLLEKIEGVFEDVVGLSETAAFDEVLTVVENGVYKMNVSGSTTPTLTLVVTGPIA